MWAKIEEHIFQPLFDKKFEQALDKLWMPKKGCIVKYNRPNYWLDGTYAEVICDDGEYDNGNPRCRVKLLTEAYNPYYSRQYGPGDHINMQYKFIRIVSE